jgi:hypothetical protein
MSVKDRWVDPCEQVLNVLIACWWYVPSKSSNMPSTDAWLKRIISMAVLGEKLSRVPRATQPGWEVESGVLFLGAVHPSNPVDDSWKVAIRGPREIRMVEGHTRTEREKRVTCWLGFPLHGVHWFESLRLSDMSNRLSRDSLHVVN